jgi:hypothetical protein
MGQTYQQTYNPLIILLGIALLIFVLWLMSLIDALKSNFTNPSDKIAWVIVIIFLGPLGMIIYSFVGNTMKLRKRDIEKTDLEKHNQERIQTPRPAIEKDDRDFSIK